jgi:hypothetical protein
VIWLTLRQHRAQIIATLTIVALLAIGLAVLGSYAAALRAALGVDTCTPLPNTNRNCVDLGMEWRQRIGPAPYLVVALVLGPALAASFIGGPLFSSELERGTHRLALTQAISRIRWSGTKLGVILALALVCGVTLAQFGWAVFAFRGAIGQLTTTFDIFDADGPPVVAYGLFGIAVGALTGAVSRRALTGMFVGLLLFAGARVFVETQLRPNYEPPLIAYQNTMTAGLTAVRTGAWVVRSEIVDAQDHPIDYRVVDEFMRGYPASVMAGGPTDMGAYLATHGVRQRVVYQPADRYAKFQWIEFGVFTGLAAGCALLTIVWVRRRDA